MAFDFYTVEGVAQIADTGERTFNLMMGMLGVDTSNLVQDTINRLEEKIDEMKDLEQDFLNTFHCSSLEAFAAKVEKYYHTNSLTTFTGSQLQVIVDEYKSYKDENKKVFLQKAQEIYNNFLLNLKKTKPEYEKAIDDIIKGRPVQNVIIEDIKALFRAELSQVSSGTLKKDYHFSTTPRGLGQSILKLTASQGTDAFKKYIDRAASLALNQISLSANSSQKELEIFNKQKFAADQLYQISSSQSAQNNDCNLNFTLKFIDLISLGDKILKGSDVKNGLIDDKELGKRNSRIIQLIVSELGLAGSYRQFFIKRISTMLDTDRTMFFTGQGVTNLEGVLGEMNAVVAITDLLGEEYTDKALRWIGSQTGTGNKQPSIDIVIDEIVGGFAKAKFGIQVKNTTQEIIDITHYINFADKNLIDILNNAGINAESIEAVYISDTFNVPFKREGYYYKQVGYETSFEHKDSAQSGFYAYIRVDKLIDTIVDSINTYLARFASDFIYMANPDFPSALATLNSQLTGVLKGNFCYIVGPKVYFANRMLQDLIMQLKVLQSLKTNEQKASLQFETYFSKKNEEGGAGYNIVDYKNSKSIDKNGKVVYKNTLDQYTLKMRTSWGFF